MDVFNKEACMACQMFDCVSQCPMSCCEKAIRGRERKVIKTGWLRSHSNPNHKNCLCLDGHLEGPGFYTLKEKLILASLTASCIMYRHFAAKGIFVE